MCQICSMNRPYADQCLYQEFAPGADPGFGVVWNEGFFDAPNGVHGRFDTGFMTVNSTFNGYIGPVRDSDWIRVDFEQGKTYHIQMYSIWMETFLALADNNGNVLVTDSYEIQSYQGFDYAVSELTVTASRTGSYFIIAEEQGHDYVGGYTVGVVEVVVPPGTQDYWTLDQIAHRLTDSGWAFFGGARRAWDKNTITYNDSAMDAKAAKLVSHAFEAWEKITGLTFVRTTGQADIMMDDEDLGKAYASSELKNNGAIQSVTINVGKDWENGPGTLDSYLFQTLVHEIGHGIGLAHAGDYNAGQGGPATYPDSVLYLNDSWNATIMSYINQSMNTNDNADYALIMTPMIADVIAIQDLYGVPVKAYAGNTRYGFNSNTGDYMDLVFDALVKKDFASNLIAGGQPLSFTLWDTGGRDVVDFRTDTMRQRINLGEEQQSTIYGVMGAMIIGRDTVIENVVAGRKGDVVFGNAASNALDGRGGHDILRGQAGKDVMRGGFGNDKLFGGAGRDVLNGQQGNDTLRGDKGADVFVFAKGYDKDTVVDFRNNLDTIRLDDTLWKGTLGVQKVLNRFGSMQDGDAVLTFGGGDVLTIENTTLAQLRDDLVII